MTATDHETTKRGRTGYIAQVSLTFIILIGLMSILGDDRLVDIIRQVSPAAFLTSMALNVVASIFLPAVVSSISAKKTAVSIGLARFVAINFMIRFFTLILPRASATGVRWFKYRTAGTGASAAALVVLEKLVQIFTYAAVAAAFLIVERHQLGGAAPAALAVAGALVAASGIGLVALLSDGVDPLLARLGFLTNVRWIGGPLRRLVEAVKSQRGRRPAQIASLALWSAAGYAFFVASAWVIAQELGIEVSIAALAWIRGLVFLGTLIPITIAGAGIREVGFVGFLSLYDIDQSTALGFALALLGVQLAIGAIGGLLQLGSTLSAQRLPARDPEVTRDGKKQTTR